MVLPLKQNVRSMKILNYPRGGYFRQKRINAPVLQKSPRTINDTIAAEPKPKLEMKESDGKK